MLGRGFLFAFHRFQVSVRFHNKYIAIMTVSLAVSTQHTNVTDTRPATHRTTEKVVLMHKVRYFFSMSHN